MTQNTPHNNACQGLAAPHDQYSSSIQTLTVGTVIKTVQSFLQESRTVPPIGNFTLP